MSINQVLRKSKPGSLFKLSILTLLGFILSISFILGIKKLILLKQLRQPIVYLAHAPSAILPVNFPQGGGFVASKSGKKYYFPWCGSVLRVQTEKKIWFASKVQAEDLGYRIAKDCN
jgi:hypothetical protein